MSTRGIQVSRDLFQATVNDHMSLEALSALVYACDLVATPSSDHSENTRKILTQKQKVFLLLRKRLQAGEQASDQVVMTIFFLLTLDVST